MSTPGFGSAQPTCDLSSHGMTASDFLLEPEAFVGRCIAAHPEAEAALTLLQRSALAEAIRAGRPRIEVIDAIRRYVSPAPGVLKSPGRASSSEGWNQYIVTDQLVRYAPDDDEAFVDQAYSQTLDRAPTSIEALEAKFDLRAGLTRSEFIHQLARRSTACDLSPSHRSIPGAGLTKDGKLSFSFIEPHPTNGWIVAQGVYVQPAPTVDDALQLHEGWVMTGPKCTFPSGDWNLSIDIVQPMMARVAVDVVANSGLDVLAKVDLVGPARLTTAFTIEPTHHFLEVRLHKAAEPESLSRLKVREFVMRQR